MKPRSDAPEYLTRVLHAGFAGGVMQGCSSALDDIVNAEEHRALRDSDLINGAISATIEALLTTIRPVAAKNLIAGNELAAVPSILRRIDGEWPAARSHDTRK